MAENKLNYMRAKSRKQNLASYFHMLHRNHTFSMSVSNFKQCVPGFTRGDRVNSEESDSKFRPSSVPSLSHYVLI